MSWIRRQRMSFFTDGSAPAGTGFWPSYRLRGDPKGSGEEKTSRCTKLGPRPFLVQFPWTRDGLTKWLHNQSIFRDLYKIMGFPDGSSGKESACRRCRQEIWVRFLGWKDPLEKEIANQSSILAWEIPWKEEPGGLQSVGSQRVGQNWMTNIFTGFSMISLYMIDDNSKHSQYCLTSINYAFPCQPAQSLNLQI